MDLHGQPKKSFFNSGRNIGKSIDELVGLAKGMLADNFLHELEVEFLITWMKANEHIAETWPANVLYERVGRALEDGKIDDDERQEIFEILKQLSGDNLSETASTTLPLCKPQPEIEFQNSVFCVTGKFAYGPRKHIVELIENKEGIISRNVTQKVDYLIVGTLASRDWAHTSFGRKIELASNLREKNGYPAIISEDHFLKSVLT